VEIEPLREDEQTRNTILVKVARMHKTIWLSGSLFGVVCVVSLYANKQNNRVCAYEIIMSHA
jgi:hypothetical protein